MSEKYNDSNYRPAQIVEGMKSVVAVGLGANRSEPILGRRTRPDGEYAYATTQSAREPRGRTGPFARKAEHRWHGPRLRGIAGLASQALVARPL
jgi:hypothetical protein